MLDNLRPRLIRPIEAVLWPLVSRTPHPICEAFFSAAVAALQPVTWQRQHTSWSTRDTKSALRHWLAPRFAHRHTYKEVAKWFEDASFGVIDRECPAAYCRLFARPSDDVGLTGRKLLALARCGC